MTQVNIMMRMMPARAMDRESMMTVPCREELLGVFQPVGNDDTSKSSMSMDVVEGGRAMVAPFRASAAEGGGQGPGHCEEP